MTTIKSIQQSKRLIKQLLIKQPILRDDDNKLISVFWRLEIAGIKEKDTLNALYNGMLTSSETIRRTRQKIQEKYPETRGEKYNERHNAEKEIRKNINSI